MKKWEKYRDEYYKNVDRFWQNFAKTGNCSGLHCAPCPLLKQGLCLSVVSGETFRKLLNEDVE